MNCLVFDDEADALAAQARFDDALGYPKCGAPVGVGIFAMHPACCSKHHMSVMRHPVDARYALPIDAAMATYIAPGDSLVALGSDWLPPQ